MVYLTFSFRKFVNIKNDEKYVVLNYMTEKNIIMHILLLGALTNCIKVGSVFVVFSQEMFYTFSNFKS